MDAMPKRKAVVSPVEVTEATTLAEEQALIKRAQENDIDAFEQLIQHYQQLVFSFACYLTDDKDQAQDIAQEALVRVFRSIRSYRGDSPFKTWLFSVIRSVFVDEMRKKHHKYMGRRESLDDESMRNKPHHEDQEEQHILKHVVYEALAKLPLNLRTSLIMYEIQGFSYDEISAIEGASLGTIKSRIFKARKSLLKDKVLVDYWQNSE